MCHFVAETVIHRMDIVENQMSADANSDIMEKIVISAFPFPDASTDHVTHPSSAFVRQDGKEFSAKIVSIYNTFKS